MDTDVNLPATLAALMDDATAGFAIGLHMRFSGPTFMFQTYPRGWVEQYSREGMVTQDPTVLWGFVNEGRVDWGDLAQQDDHGVMAKARDWGLGHGVTVSLLRDGSRTIGSFARPDRPFTAEEVDRIEARMVALHDSTASGGSLTEEVRESLHRLSVAFTHP